ncbi:D-alanyl-D-alanine carboxypeptidase [Ciceribacter sp. L1K23]|uniref:D-alanyl-D-alanine carboxypeptidase family protein n=1 Tax=Ciceribacter sp. L1K23 TaxID=2820276 RepID=UPI001B81C019|nr:D-alanyl-D-alanine carboxypeptidase family protein [Ciceribacter sp. L1K23]MBR0555543.1 D-alanyl-D-alanine carboxypeptidase [Ciceribacter sp. L1K23]
MRTCLAVLALIFLVLTTPAIRAQEAPGFEAKAPRVLMIEDSTGTVLLAKGENEVFPPASLAKLMTLEVVFDALKRGEITLDTTYTVSEHAWRTGGAPSRTSTMFAALKSTIRVEDLLKGIAVQMANDGCIILAEGMAGSEAAFAARMTDRAKAIGLKNSTFSNATGLPDPGNRTTLADMVTLARHLHATYPEQYRLLAQTEFEWNKILQRNRNNLLALALGVDGLTSGYAEESGFAIVTSAEANGVRLFLAMSGLASEKERTEESIRVLQWGQTKFERRSLFKAGEAVGAASVYGGAVSTVDLKPTSGVDVFLPVNNPDRLSARIVYRWPLTAPVEAEQSVGELRILAGERVLRTVPLVTVAAVEKGTLRQQAWDALVELLFFWL